MKNKDRKVSFSTARPEAGDRAAAAPGYRTLPYSVVGQIGRQIVNGVLQPGDALPNADESAVMLGVSRTVLREAIKVLAGKGLVVSRPKTGTRVRPRSDWNFLDPDILSWRYEGTPGQADVRALFELRRAIEPMAASLAAAHATPEQIEIINAALAEMKDAKDDGELFAGPDLVFHQTILRMTGNELIGSLGAMIETALVTSFRLSDQNPDGQQHSLPLHVDVAEAIQRGDGAAAQQAMTALLDGAEDDVRRGLLAQAERERVQGAGPTPTESDA